VVTAIEPPFAFLEEQKKVGLGYAVEPPEVALGLVPKILDPIDVILFVGKEFRVIDSNMMKARNIQGVITLEGIRVDDAIRQDHPFHNGQKRCTFGIGYHDSVNPSTALQEPENRDFTGSTPATFAFPYAAEIAFIDFDLSGKGRSFFHFIGNDFSQASVECRRGISVNAHQLGGCSCRCAGNEMLNEPCSFLDAESTLSGVHGRCPNPKRDA